MGACCAGLPTVKDGDRLPDPTGPSTFFLSKQSLLSSNYKARGARGGVVVGRGAVWGHW